MAWHFGLYVPCFIIQMANNLYFIFKLKPLYNLYTQILMKSLDINIISWQIKFWAQLTNIKTTLIVLKYLVNIYIGIGNLSNWYESCFFYCYSYFDVVLVRTPLKIHMNIFTNPRKWGEKCLSVNIFFIKHK